MSMTIPYGRLSSRVEKIKDHKVLPREKFPEKQARDVISSSTRKSASHSELEAKSSHERLRFDSTEGGEAPFQKITAPKLVRRKFAGEKITALTAYDYTTAILLDRAGIDFILVGDSLSSSVQGHQTTIPVTLEEMIYHCRCVTRGATRALVVGDLPFMSYQISPEQALESAGRLVKDGGVGAVKLEGGIHVAPAIEKIVAADIPVCAHIGLTPQSYHRMGGHRVQGKSKSGEGSVAAAGSRERIIEDALAVEEAGAFAVVLECIPAELAKTISQMLSIPTIGIGAGPDCDGQILVTPDLLGLNLFEPAKFVKTFADFGKQTVEAARQYIREIHSAVYPASEHSYVQERAIVNAEGGRK